jgi:hypothetical protein
MRALSIVAGCGLSIGLAACGGPNIGQFVGTWLYTSGELTTSCGTLTLPAVPLAGGTRVLAQDSEGTLTETLHSGCELKYNVSGSTASLSSPVSCTVSVPIPDAGNMMLPINFTSETYTIDGTGKTLTEAGSFSTTIVIVTCTFSTNGTLSKQ